MYSGFKHVTPWEVASDTSTLKSPGFSRLKSANRWVASRYKDGEGLGSTWGERLQLRTVFDHVSLLAVLSIMCSVTKSESLIRITFHFRKLWVVYLTHETAATFAPPDCSRRLNPESLLWSMFSMTVHPLNAPWEAKNTQSSAEYKH